MATTVKISDPSLVSFHNQRQIIFDNTQKQVNEQLPIHEKNAATFKDFEEKVNAKDRLYQQATESFIPAEGIVGELKVCTQEYQGYKEILAKVSLLAENILASIHFLKPISRSIKEEKSFQADAPDLYAQVKQSEKICLGHIEALQASLSKTLELKNKLLEQIHNPKINASLQRFLGILDNQGKPLPTAARAFTDAALLKFHTQCENAYAGIKGQIASQLPDLRTAVKETETFAKDVRSEGSAYQNATVPLNPKEVVLNQAKQFCGKFHEFSAMHEKISLLEAQVSKTIQLLIPAARTAAEENSLKETNRQLYEETKVSEDACKGYAAQLEKSLGTIKELNAQLSAAIEDGTTKWALVRVCEIVKNDCQPLPLTSRSMNFLSAYVCNQVIPKPEELKLPEPKKKETDQNSLELSS